MSTALPFAGMGALLSSPAESVAFGFEVARLSIGGTWADDVADAGVLAHRVENILLHATEDTVIVRFPSELVEVARLELPGRRRLQHAGTLVYWEDPLLDKSAHDTELHTVVFRGGKQPSSGFVGSAIDVVADAFDGYLNHYAYNVQIPTEMAREGYADWARRTIADPAGAAMLLSDDAGSIAAATLRFHTGGEPLVGEVELAAVVSDRQGSGRYRDLWSAIRTTAHEAGAERLIISTQASNIRVQRAWARLGLLPLMCFDTVHAIALHGE